MVKPCGPSRKLQVRVTYKSSFSGPSALSEGLMLAFRNPSSCAPGARAPASDSSRRYVAASLAQARHMLLTCHGAFRHSAPLSKAKRSTRASSSSRFRRRWSPGTVTRNRRGARALWSVHASQSSVASQDARTRLEYTTHNLTTTSDPREGHCEHKTGCCLTSATAATSR